MLYSLLRKYYSYFFILSLFLQIAVHTPVAGQRDNGGSIEVADKYFDNMEYYMAAQEYEKVVKNNPSNKNALFRLAESYRLSFEYEKAELNYKRLLTIAEKEYPLARFWVGILQKTNGKYEEAIASFEKFLQSYKPTGKDGIHYKDRAKIELDGCHVAITEMKKPQRDYEFENLPSPVNTENSEYSPTIGKHDSLIVIASARKESIGEDQYTTLGGEFTDKYRFEKNNGGGWTTLGDEDAFNALNTKYNESPGSFTQDGNKFYYTSCDEKIKHDDYEEYNCAIYVTKLENGKWSKPERLNDHINLKGYWNAQPSVSPNGDTLFFVSKRPGGQGMHDIWYSTCKGDDNWGMARNMGPKVNTKHIDMSPCYHSTIDSMPVLFFASNGHQGFGGLDIFEAKGPKFEDIRNLGLPFNSNKDDFYFVAGKNKAYLSSNREGGQGNDDIYMFNVKSEEEAVIAQIDKDSLGNAKSISIEGKLVDATTKDPATDVTVKLNNDKKKTLKTTTTNEKGEFRYENLPADNYKVVLEEKNTKLTSEVKYMAEDLEVKKSRKKPSKKLYENIYFDFDKYTLRPEAEKSLEDLVEYYKKHPQLQIEMNANTDNLGSDVYNIQLSRKRGKTALSYLIENGVDKSALVVNALGEGKPIASNKNVIGRQLNRRVEFYVVGGPGYRAKAMTYVIQPKTTLYSVAKMFNMTVEELKAMNNLKDENILAYRPLRVRRIGDDDIIAPITLSLGTANIMNSSVDSAGNTFNTKLQSSNKIIKELKRGEDLYIVEPKNTLFSIGKQYGMTVDELKELNGLNSDLILIGQRLKVKTTVGAEVTSYVVKEGDTMFSIAKRFGLSLEELRQLNHLSSYTLYKGMVLRVNKKLPY